MWLWAGKAVAERQDPLSTKPFPVPVAVANIMDYWQVEIFGNIDEVLPQDLHAIANCSNGGPGFLGTLNLGIVDGGCIAQRVSCRGKVVLVIYLTERRWRLCCV